ncbi:MAG TPA: glycine--tRNA ligase subunit beta, partial [Nitrospiria bacterium]|nr:glycine--tRNA ligase subunit beta [Nitrospiria bacterium]
MTESRRPRRAIERKKDRRPQTASAALLVEIGCEEIPSGVMENTLRQMKERAGELFAEHRIDHEELRVLGTPRRLVLTAELALMQRASVQEVLGPARRISYDPQGNPTAAALGFARSQGIDPALLKIKATDRGEYVCVVREEKGRPTAERLRDLIPRWLTSLSFPRSMRWNGSGVSFVRPIRWIVSLLGGEEIPFPFAGISSGRVSRGHAILSPAPFRVTSREQYFRESRKRFVEVDPEVRYGKIEKEIDLLAEKKGGSAPHDEELLLQATFSTEWPTALWGEFDTGFLLLPPEVIMSVLREQQGYFPILAGKKLLSSFIVIGNVAGPSRVVQAGNERVLRARLVDAQFYFEADRKVKLSNRVEGLRDVGFLPRLGSMYDKTERLVGLSGALAERIDPAVKSDAERAARLSKADLLSGVIREFPNLQ